MKISVNGQDLFELSETKKKIIKNDILDEEFDSDMKRRLQWVIEHKYEKCLKRLKDEWMPKLKELGVTSVPLDDEAFAETVFNRKEYKSRTARELEKKEQIKKQKLN